MGKKMICSIRPENESEIDVYRVIRSAEIRDYYRWENVCDNWEKR